MGLSGRNTVQEFDMDAEYASERAVSRALTISDGWAYAVDEIVGGDTLLITSLQSDHVTNVSRNLFRTRDALIEYIWKRV